MTGGAGSGWLPLVAVLPAVAGGGANRRLTLVALTKRQATAKGAVAPVRSAVQVVRRPWRSRWQAATCRCRRIDQVRAGDVPVIVTAIGTVTAARSARRAQRVDGLLQSVSFPRGAAGACRGRDRADRPLPFQAALQQAQGQLAGRSGAALIRRASTRATRSCWSRTASHDSRWRRRRHWSSSRRHLCRPTGRRSPRRQPQRRLPR